MTERASSGSKSERTRATFEVVEDNDRANESEPTAMFSKAEVQQLFDELWKIGFRPNDGKDSEAERSAMLTRALEFAQTHLSRNGGQDHDVDRTR